MEGIDQRRESIVLEKVLGLISKRRLSEVTKAVQRERQNKRQKLYKIYIPVIAKWLEPKKKVGLNGAQSSTKVALSCSTANIIATSLC